MLFRKLGTTDVEVSLACLGTMTFGEQNTEEEAWEQLDYFVAQGGNFIDTAELYPVPPCAETCGRTEEIIGRWMKARGNRDKIFLASKVVGGGRETRNFVVANRTVPPSKEAARSALEPAQIFAAVESSLRRLQTDSLDLLQLHWPDRYAPLFGKNQFRAAEAAAHQSVPFEDQVAAVGELLKSKRIKHWALSNETAYGVCRMCEAAAKLGGIPPPVSIQNDFSLLDRRFENSTAEACYYNGIGLLVYGGLAGGTLTDKYNDGGTPPANSRHVKYPGFQPRYHSERSKTAAKRYYDLAQKKGMSLSVLALAWCKSREYVTSIIIGATTMEHLKENIAALEVDLDEETLKEIDEIHLSCPNPNCTD